DLFHKNFNQVRLLGMNKTGQTYLNKIKNSLDIQIVSSLKSFGEDSLETKVSDVYYTAVNPHFRKQLINQEYAPPIILNKNSRLYYSSTVIKYCIEIDKFITVILSISL